MAHTCGCHATQCASVLDVREMAPRIRHPKIFETLDALRPGEAFVLVNDHDPKPLFYQLQAERAGAFRWTYLAEGPEVWRVEIARPAAGIAIEALPDRLNTTAGRVRTISRQTTLGSLLDEHPALVDVLAGYHAHFASLRDPQTRKVMAPRVTVAQAASMAGVAPEALLDVICRALGEPTPEPEEEGGLPAGTREPRPAALAAVPAEAIVHLDVRDDIKKGAEPFGAIMGAVKSLGGDQVLVLRAPFEPFPLYQVLGQRGFAHWTERRAADDWSVWFYRQAAHEEPRGGIAPAPAPSRESRRAVMDVRGLEPPQPMVLVLEEADRLTPGESLEVIHDRRPVFLYPQLDERGLEHQTDEPEPGLVRIVIRRKA